MTDITIENLNESFIRVTGDTGIRYELHDKFSFFVEGSQFSPKVKYGIWDGKIRLYNINQQTLPKGLLVDLLKYAKEEGLSVTIDPTLKPQKVEKQDFDEWLKPKRITGKGGVQIQPHWYQYDAVLHGLNSERGLLKLPTSAGKSLIIALLSRWEFEAGGRVLILVPTDILRSQMHDDLLDYSLFTESEVAILQPGSKKKMPNQRVIITTWQTAMKQSKEWLEGFSMLLNDEVHLATGKSLATINEKMVYARYKLGLTGTLKDTKCHLMQLQGLFGSVFAPITTREMIDEGSASAIGVQGLILQYPDEHRKEVSGFKYVEEIDWIINNQKRNEFLVKVACNFKNENTIVLFNRVEHGKKLYEMAKEKLKGTGRKVYLIFGGTAKDDREVAKKALETEVGSIVIASYGVFSTGVSINNLHNAIFAHPTKSKIISLQSLGRLLRKHSSKSKARLFDIIDDLCWKKSKNYTYEHGVERLKFYNAEDHELTITKVPL